MALLDTLGLTFIHLQQSFPKYLLGLWCCTKSGFTFRCGRTTAGIKGTWSRYTPLFCPVHLQPLAKKYPITTFGEMSVSEKLWNRGIYLPSGLGNTTEEFDAVIEAMWRLVKK